MGRWAQRRRGRGGGGINTAITIVTVEASTALTTNFTFSADVDVSDFDPTDFTSAPSAAGGFSLSQLDPQTIEVTWDSDTTDDTDATYAGSAPGVVSPQTVPYS